MSDLDWMFVAFGLSAIGLLGMYFYRPSPRKKEESQASKERRRKAREAKALADIIKKEGLRSCPKHPKIKMSKKRVEGIWIDKCSKCKGVFLDGNELSKLRGHARSEGYSSGYSSGGSAGHSSGLATGLVIGMVLD